MVNPITRLNPSALPDAAPLGYSQITIMEPGRLAFVSGQVASRPGGLPAPDSLAAQAKIVATNARAALHAIGALPEHLVMVRIYATDLTPERVQVVMSHLEALFAGAKPSLTGIGVAALASPDLQVEVEMIVRLP